MKVRLVDSQYWASAVNFGNEWIHIPDNYVRDYERLLTGGIWAQIDMRFEYDDENKGKNPFWIDRLTPIQVATFDLEDIGDFALSSTPMSGSMSSYGVWVTSLRSCRAGSSSSSPCV